MTLQEFLDLRILKDNVRLLVFKKDCHGLGDFEHTFDITRIMGRVVEADDLLKHGVQPEMLNYEVKEIWGDQYKYKVGLVIEAKE